MAGFDNEVMFANNVDFTGNTVTTAQVTANGQLLIGSTVSPNIRVGTLTSADSSIITTNGAGTIGLSVTNNLSVTHLNSGTNASSSTFWRGDGTWATPASGGGGITTIAGDTGTPTAGPTVTFNGGIASSNPNGMVFSVTGDILNLNYPYLNLPRTNTSGNGILYMENEIGNNLTLLHVGGNGTSSNNTFLGANAGNFSSIFIGTNNTGIGASALNALAASGGEYNTVVGSQAGILIDNGDNNSSFGAYSLTSCRGGNSNSGFGIDAFYNLVGGNNNSGIGLGCGTGIVSGSFNVALGDSTLSGSDGSYNICIGSGAGGNFASTESSNIEIGNAGNFGDNNVMRLGTDGVGNGQVNQTFVAGITGRTVTGSAVLCSATGELGTIVSSARYKENIKDIDSSISVLELRPVEFNYKKEKAGSSGCEKQYGLIAEEVHKDFPYLCLYNDKDLPESVKYHELPVFLLHEIKKLKYEIEDLKKKMICYP